MIKASNPLYQENYQFSIASGTVVKRDHYFDPPLSFSYGYHNTSGTPLAGVYRTFGSRPKTELEKFFVTQWVPSSKKVLLYKYQETYYKLVFHWKGKGKKRRRIAVHKARKRTVKVYKVLYFFKKKITLLRRFSTLDGKGKFMKPNPLLFRSYSNVKLPRVTAHLIYDGPGPWGVNNEYINSLTTNDLFIFDPNITGGGGGHMYNQAPLVTPSLWTGDIIDDELRIKALRKLYTKAYSSMPDYLTSFAETDEMLKTIRTIFRQGAALLIDLLSMNLKRLSGRILAIKPKDITDLWLTWVYGIKPVIQDIEDTLKLISTRDRVWRSYSASANKVTETESSGLTSSCTYTSKEKLLQFHRFGVIVEGKLGFEEFIRRSEHWEAAVGTYYELIPFSFMLDWLVDVGSYIKGAHFFEGLQYSAWETHGTVRTVVGDVLGRTNDYREVASGKSSQVTSFVSVQRQVLDELPELPGLTVPTSDQLLGAFSVQRTINALSILISRQPH